MADVAIVIGHHPDAKGAPLRVGHKLIQEYDLWMGFGQALVDSFPGKRAVLVTRPNPDPDQALADRINATGADCAVELHHNSYKDPSANGTEMLHHHASQGGKMLAHLLHESTVDALGTKRRGVKPKRGYAFLSKTKMTAVIAEPGFATNESDAWALLTRQAPLLSEYRSAITRWLNDTA